ncbi:MAG: hypothetical protein IPO27_05765 [Bacteroidetes bacterium]|nr:hypothetical protein [Bacteroidota bacterium]
MTEAQRTAALPKIYEAIKKEATKDTWYEADVRSFIKITSIICLSMKSLKTCA